MKLAVPRNANYAATVVEVKTIVPLAGCDNIVGTPLLGYQAIVSNNTAPGELGVVFTAETQLSGEFSHVNNLYRHTELNSDKTATGYLEDNGRVKAVKLRGHRSDALFMYLDSLAYTGADLSQLQPGDTFDYLNGHEVCRKYEVKVKGHAIGNAPKLTSRVDDKMFPKHFDTDNFFKNIESVHPFTRASFTQKLHGTSLRLGYIPVARKLSWLERLAQRFGVRVDATEYAMVYGSRNQVKDANDPSQNHFYDSDLWTMTGKKFDGALPKDYLVFAEIIGWTPDGAPIQKGFTYGLPHGTSDVYVYRVAHINPSGYVVDLSWTQLKEFCQLYGFKHVPELWSGCLAQFTPEEIAEYFLDKKFHLKYPQAVPLAGESPCDEGICIRIEGLTPKVLKAKSPKFLQHETKMLDKEVLDIEANDA